MRTTVFNVDSVSSRLLFQENSDGEIIYTDIVDIKAEAEKIRQTVKDYIMDQKAAHNINVNIEVDNSKKIVAKIIYPVNKSYWAVELFGSPVVSGIRDASRVTFKCMVEFLNNKYRYTLNDFWTDNMRISGEAKDNGPTNIIYQQRLNSLQKEYRNFADNHDIRKRSVKEKLYDYKEAIEFEENQYVCAYASVMDFLSGLKNLKLFDFSGSFDQNVEVINKENVPVRLDLSNFHGNLLAKGNSVFINMEGLTPAELSGARELMKQVSIDKFWKLVTTRDQAHFVLEYHMSTAGRDHAWLEIRSRDNSIICKNMSGNYRGTSESIGENRDVARKLYFSVITQLYDDVLRGKSHNVINQFMR